MKFVSYISGVLLMMAPFASMANDDTASVDAVDLTLDTEIIEPVTAKSPWYSGIEFGVGVSATSGLNGFVGYANKDSSNWLMRRLGLRLDFATTKPIASIIDSGVDSIIGDDGFEIDEIAIKHVDIDAKHIGAIVDFYPFGDTWFLGGWRISGGYFAGDLNIGANLTGNVDVPAGEYGFTFGGIDYKYNGGGAVHGTAEIDWDFSGPYLGTGFDFGLFAGFKIYVDAGVVFTGNSAKIDANIPTTGLNQSTDGGNTWTPVASMDSEIGRVLSDVQSELDRVDFYPMAKVGFMYRF